MKLSNNDRWLLVDAVIEAAKKLGVNLHNCGRREENGFDVLEFRGDEDWELRIETTDHKQERIENGRNLRREITLGIKGFNDRAKEGE